MVDVVNGGQFLKSSQCGSNPDGEKLNVNVWETMTIDARSTVSESSFSINATTLLKVGSNLILPLPFGAICPEEKFTYNASTPVRQCPDGERGCNLCVACTGGRVLGSRSEDTF